MMRALVAGGANPKLAIPNGSDAMMFAARQGWRNGSPAAPSYDQGSEEEAVEALRFLLELGFDINGTNDAGDSPLHAAVTRRSSEIIAISLALARWAGARGGPECRPLSPGDSSHVIANGCSSHGDGCALPRRGRQNLKP
jgi:hypothetical protein